MANSIMTNEIYEETSSVSSSCLEILKGSCFESVSYLGAFDTLPGVNELNLCRVMADRANSLDIYFYGCTCYEGASQQIYSTIGNQLY